MFCCMLVMKCTCKKKDDRTNVLVIATCRYRSSTVFLMRKENHPTTRPWSLYVVRQGLRPPWKWLVISDGVASWKPHHPSSKVFIVWSYFKDNPQMAYQVNGKNIYLWEALLCAPLSHITVSSIFKKDSVCAMFASVSYHIIHSFACDSISSVSKRILNYLPT